MKTLLFPITVFAWCTVQKTSALALGLAALWTWLYLLQFCVSNQCVFPNEDAHNKPWRPIPSRRITRTHALVLRWALVPLCLLLSAALGVTHIGLVLTLEFVLHNEFGLDSHWLARSVLVTLGYAGFDAGATAIARAVPGSAVPPAALAASRFSIAILLTTIHAQDFRDEAGDRLGQRKTIPIVMPRVGRMSMPVGMVVWSVALGIWTRSLLQFSALLAIGSVVGARFYFLRTAESDRLSYLIYNVWLAIARVAPIYA